MNEPYTREQYEKKKKTKLDLVADMSIDFESDYNNPDKNKDGMVEATMAGLLYIISKDTRYEEYVEPVLEAYYDRYDCRPD